MAKIKSPDMGIVGRLGKVLDFYYWKGIPCVRTYPRRIKQPGTDAQWRTWHAMLFAIDMYGEMDGHNRHAWRRLCVPPERTGKDYFYRIILKGYNQENKVFAMPLCWVSKGSGGKTKVVLEKHEQAHLKVALMNLEERRRMLLFKEETHCLRGKKWRRKFKLYDTTERAKYHVDVLPGQRGCEFEIMPGPEYRFLTGKIIDPSNIYYGRLGLYDLVLD